VRRRPAEDSMETRPSLGSIGRDEACRMMVQVNNIQRIDIGNEERIEIVDGNGLESGRRCHGSRRRRHGRIRHGGIELVYNEGRRLSTGERGGTRSRSRSARR